MVKMIKMTQQMIEMTKKKKITKIILKKGGKDDIKDDRDLYGLGLDGLGSRVEGSRV